MKPPEKKPDSIPPPGPSPISREERQRFARFASDIVGTGMQPSDLLPCTAQPSNELFGDGRVGINWLDGY